MTNQNRIYSITEASKLTGLTRQTVYKRLDTDLKPFLDTSTGKKMITEEGLQVLRERNNSKNKELRRELDTIQNRLNELSHVNQELTNRLNEIETIVNRLEANTSKDDAIAVLTRMLDEKSRIPTAEVKSIETVSDTDLKHQEDEQPEKRGFFRRFLGGR